MWKPESLDEPEMSLKDSKQAIRTRCRTPTALRKARKAHNFKHGHKEKEDAHMQRYRPGCSWCISHCLLQQAVEHSALQPGFAPGYKQAVLGHTVTMAAAPCSGPPEYTCPPPPKKVTLFAFVLKFICKPLQSKALQCILTEGLIKSQRRRNALKAPVKKKTNLNVSGEPEKKSWWPSSLFERRITEHYVRHKSQNYSPLYLQILSNFTRSWIFIKSDILKKLPLL